MTVTRTAAIRLVALVASVLLVGGVLAQSAYPPQSYPPPSYSQQAAPQGYPPQNYPTQQGYPAQQPGNAAPAASAQAGDENADDPTRGVARIAILQGEANVRRGDSGELVAAAINAPIVSQDHLITAPGSRAEVQLDSANVVRLAASTEVVLADVEYHKFQIQLVQGAIMYSVVRDLKAEVEIDTPSIAIHPRRIGEYRITILPDGTTQVTVRSGSIEVFSPSGSEFLEAGRTMMVRGPRQAPEFVTSAAIAMDEFDSWSAGRNQQMQHSQSYHNVASDIFGADDLDQYGRWVPSEYGQSWVPNNPAPDWSPYSNGQWSWTDYYGWTWVDSAPWGWAPYHYGRWFWNGGYGWAWYPGPMYSPYHWRPALVGFFGFGGFSIGFGFGSIGWCPLAPFEMFHPWYGHGHYYGYGSTYSIVHNSNVTNVYRNARYMNGVTATSANNFGNGRQSYVRPSASQLTQAGLMHGGVPVTPTQRSLQFSSRSASTNASGFSRGNQQFYSRFQGSKTARVPFATQAHQVQQSSQNSFARGPGQGGFKLAQPQSSAGAGNTGWHSFGQSSTGVSGQSGMTRPGAAAPESASGWHAFGSPHPGAPGAPSNGFRSGTPGSGYASPQSTYRGGSSYQAPPTIQPRGAGSYSAPSYSAPQGRGYVAPQSHYSAPQSRYSGSTGGSAQHSSGGSSHPSSSGGSRSSGGHSSGGGGGHSSSGGGGRHH